jgi:hypothetical protein
LFYFYILYTSKNVDEPSIPFLPKLCPQEKYELKLSQHPTDVKAYKIDLKYLKLTIIFWTKICT